MMFGPTRKAVTGGWRELNNEKFNKLYSLPDIIRVIGLGK
jgi:hypothetical protein